MRAEGNQGGYFEVVMFRGDLRDEKRSDMQRTGRWCRRKIHVLEAGNKYVDWCQFAESWNFSLVMLSSPGKECRRHVLY